MNYVTYISKNRIGYITLNRPEKRNALNFAFIAELKEVFLEAEKDDSVKVLVLKANGETFCAGADLEYMESIQHNSFKENLADSTHLMELFRQIYLCPKIVIACVQGHAIAGGCGLATVCDFVFSAPESLFGYTEVKLGFIPALVSVFLLRKIGEAKSKELLLTGNLIKATDAQKIGLINFVVDSNEIEEKVFTFANNLCNTVSENSLNNTKKLISDIQNLNLKSGLELAALKNAEVRESDDFKNGMLAFLKKEKSNW